MIKQIEKAALFRAAFDFKLECNGNPLRMYTCFADVSGIDFCLLIDGLQKNKNDDNYVTWAENLLRYFEVHKRKITDKHKTSIDIATLIRMLFVVFIEAFKTYNDYRFFNASIKVADLFKSVCGPVCWK